LGLKQPKCDGRNDDADVNDNNYDDDNNNNDKQQRFQEYRSRHSADVQSAVKRQVATLHTSTPRITCALDTTSCMSVNK